MRECYRVLGAAHSTVGTMALDEPATVGEPLRRLRIVSKILEKWGTEDMVVMFLREVECVNEDRYVEEAACSVEVAARS